MILPPLPWAPPTAGQSMFSAKFTAVIPDDLNETLQPNTDPFGPEDVGATSTCPWAPPLPSHQK